MEAVELYVWDRAGSGQLTDGPGGRQAASSRGLACGARLARLRPCLTASRPRQLRAGARCGRPARLPEHEGARDQPRARCRARRVRRGDSRRRRRARRVASGRDGRPPGRSGRLRRRDHLRRRHARRSGRRAPLDHRRARASWRSCSPPGCRCSASASARSCSRAPPGERCGGRASPRSAGATCGSRRPARATRSSAHLAPGFEAYRVAQLRVPAAAARDDPRRQRRLRAGLPDRRELLGHPVPRRGHGDRRARLDPRLRRPPTRTRSGSASTRRRCARRRASGSRPGTTLGRGLCTRFLAAAERYSPVSGVR